MRWLMADWVINFASAALEKLFISTTRQKAFNLWSSMGNIVRGQ
jgi:hypothetical protein